MAKVESVLGKKTLNSKNPKEIIKQGQLNEMIQKKAYELYVKRGRTSGDELVDWLEAEKQVKKQLL